MKPITTSLKMLIFMTLLTGVFYPLLVTVLSQTFFHWQANGSLMVEKNSVKGSYLIGQKFESQKYFWSRPSAIDYNPLPSGGSNLSLSSQDLRQKMEERKNRWQKQMPSSPISEVSSVPADFLFASGSGLDPDISVNGALAQVVRVSKARGADPENIKSLVAKVVIKRQFGFLGEERINVLELNKALDQM